MKFSWATTLNLIKQLMHSDVTFITDDARIRPENSEMFHFYRRGPGRGNGQQHCPPGQRAPVPGRYHRVIKTKGKNPVQSPDWEYE
jgi:hypothetical protein